METKNNKRIRLRKAHPLPFGATVQHGGIRFSLFSRHATKVTIHFFKTKNSKTPYKSIPLTPDKYRFGDIWSVFIEGVSKNQIYAYSIEGDEQPDFCFKPDKYLIDPYSKAVVGYYSWEKSKYHEQFTDYPNVPRSVVITDSLSWHKDHPVKIPWEDMVIYEVHIKGFTAHPSSITTNRGTFSAFKQKIPYLKELGVTSVEFLPIQAFPKHENININPLTGEQLTNYWGYSTMAFMSLHPEYSSAEEPEEQINEFRDLVRELHSNNIEVILDIVFNHTAEGNEHGPILSFKGIDKPIYYMLDSQTGKYKNFSGCGNTVNCNHPLVRDFILDVLRYWVVEMHVDGFRFDLASILGRDQHGNLLDNPPLVERISEDPILRGVKIIAEAWDAGGAYQVGSFPGTRWAEWNGRYRDDIRKFWLTDKDGIANFATRIAGSEDLYGPSSRTPLHSINFITAHDGFTLRDLVSYNEKHNIPNGENNQDGTNCNFSCNHGFEGKTEEPSIRKSRIKSIKNLLATLFLSQGVPMLLSGDETGHTAYGNNNPYCQDNPTTWKDWRNTGSIKTDDFEKYTVQGYPNPTEQDVCENKNLLKFTKKLIELRKKLPIFKRKTFFEGKIQLHSGLPDIKWHNEFQKPVDWHSSRRVLGVFLGTIPNNNSIYNAPLELFFNAESETVQFSLPNFENGEWYVFLDTSEPECQPSETPSKLKIQNQYTVQPYSVVLLIFMKNTTN